MIIKKSITLNPGASGVVAFTITPVLAKTYSVDIDGLSGSFNVLEPLVAEFEVTNLVITPAEIYIGETVDIEVTVTNIGGLVGTYEVTCEVL